ncbi:alpha/beta fold hydrolase [Granulicella sp. L60]|uniref:alpha/beta fold hydrolase n=1 Tax=Granulicella sp. L60 TaxID=1641866 RepID=UPI00210FF071|nr:alpha/beta fold hydrolase [Granulicella sp. L60]
MEFQQADFIVHDFQFASGQILPELKLHYRTLGSPAYDQDGQISNAVLMLHGTTGSGEQFTQPETANFLFQPGQPLDATKFFVILPDAIGHGGTSKPSNGLRTQFPRYTYDDIVEAQYLLVTEGLKITRLRLLLGTSMGGMQTWVWGERYPDLMRAIMPIACFPERVKGRNLLWRRMLINIIEEDSGYQDGNYRKQPANLGIAWSLFNLMVDSPLHLQEAFADVAAADATVMQTFETGLKGQDANDVIYEFDASHDYNPSVDLETIKAPLFVVNFADDGLNAAELGIIEKSIKRVPHGRAVLVPMGPKTRGHQTLRVAEVWAQYVREILEETEEKPVTAKASHV